MPFPWTLQRYLCRELGKTFVLASLTLMVVLGLGGGVLNMIKLGDVTPGQLLRLMAILLPLSAALTLPIAALFSATSTYGRLSADNEFVACKSSGINMHVLFLPTVVLSLFGAIVSFVLTNFLIPGMVRNLNEFVGADVGALIQQRLNRPRGITLGGKYRIYADHCTTDPADPNQVTLSGVAFVEVDGDEWVRFGTAREVRLNFDRSDAGLRVAGSMVGLSFYDQKLGNFFEEAQQTIPPNVLPSPVPRKIKFLNLGELFHYLSEPASWVEVREKMERLRVVAEQRVVVEAMWQDWLDDRVLKLDDGRTAYTIASETGALVPRGGGIELTDVTIDEERAGRRRRITADRASIELSRGAVLEECKIRIDAYDARVVTESGTVTRSKTSLTPVAVSDELVERAAKLTDADLLSPAAPGVEDPLAERRRAAVDARAETVRRIVAAIHERTAFSISVLVLVTLGAVLGIVFHGSHMMTAFGISFAPMLFVIIAIVTGKQMSHNAGTHVLGLMVLWSGIVVVAGLDVWMLTRVLRR